MNENTVPGLTNMKFLFRALSHSNYRVFFIGQAFGNFGFWLQQIAIGWFVYRITDSPFLLGLIAFVSQIPAFLFAPFGGVLIDRFNRHRILIATQSVGVVQSVIFTLLILSGNAQYSFLIILAITGGLVGGFDAPARQAFIVDIIAKKEYLANAIALNSTLFNAARLIGPSLAGILIAIAGEGICLAIASVCYVLMLVALFFIRTNPLARLQPQVNVIQGIREGISYSFGLKPLRSVILLTALVTFMAMPYANLMPVFARDILKGGPELLGFLMATAGIGALIGAIYLASRASISGLGKQIPLTALILGAGLVVFSVSSSPWFSVLIMPVIGFGIMAQGVFSMTVLQALTDDDKRGRVMSFFFMAAMGMAPLGTLLAGALAERIGAPITLFMGGIFCIIAGFIFKNRMPET